MAMVWVRLVDWCCYWLVDFGIGMLWGCGGLAVLVCIC